MPQDRDGRFSTELFERYQRSEQALVAVVVQRGGGRGQLGGLEVALDHAASTAFQISGAVFEFDAKLVEFELTLSDPVHEFDAGDRSIAALRKRLRPSIGPSRSLIDRWSCSIWKLLTYLRRPDLALISLQGCSLRASAAPRCDALIAVERDLVVAIGPGVGGRPSEERLGGGDDPRLARSRKSTVFPSLSTAR